MMGMPDHQFHALIAQERVQRLRSTMLAARCRRRLRQTDTRTEAGRHLPRLEHQSLESYGLEPRNAA